MIILNVEQHGIIQVKNIYSISYMMLILSKNDFLRFYLISSKTDLILNKNQIKSVIDFIDERQQTTEANLLTLLQ
jgi:hypothetical protein